MVLTTGHVSVTPEKGKFSKAFWCYEKAVSVFQFFASPHFLDVQFAVYYCKENIIMCISKR